jgi:predicted adenylyl cyclase CyaB
MSTRDSLEPKLERVDLGNEIPEELETRLPGILNDFEEKLIGAGAKIKVPKRVVSDTRFKRGKTAISDLNFSFDQQLVLSSHGSLAATLRYAGFSVTESNMASSFGVSSYTPPKKYTTLRIRVDNPENPKCFLTVKGPKIDSAGIKKRPELEAEIRNLDQILKLFKQVGITVSSVVEKERTSFKFNGCKIEIDKLPIPGFPPWAEIEGPSEEEINKTLEQIRAITSYQGDAVAIGQTEFIATELKILGIEGVDTKKIMFEQDGKS